MERNVPPDRVAKIFQELAEMVGRSGLPGATIGLITGATGVRYHRDQFARLAGQLRGSSYRVAVASLMTTAEPWRGSTGRVRWGPTRPVRAAALAQEMVFSAGENGFTVYSCAEKLDLTLWYLPGSCIDPAWLNQLFGFQLPPLRIRTAPLCRCAPVKISAAMAAAGTAACIVMPAETGSRPVRPGFSGTGLITVFTDLLF